MPKPLLELFGVDSFDMPEDEPKGQWVRKQVTSWMREQATDYFELADMVEALLTTLTALACNGALISAVVPWL